MSSSRFAGQALVATLACGASLGACHGRAGDPGAPAQSAAAAAPAQPSASASSASPAASVASATTAVGGLVSTFRLTPQGGVGFDDLWFSPELHAVLAPAGGTGCVQLFDSGTLAKTSVCGVGPGGSYTGGHGIGTTSADYGAGWIFASDRSSQSLQVVDPQSKRIVTTVQLSGGPDYVRWVPSKKEVWVTEPDKDQIEIFKLAPEQPPKLTEAGKIAVEGGPESLVIDASRDRAFTHLWRGRTVQIALGARSVSPSFANGCKGSRGIALDAERGQLFVGCAEGKAVSLDLNQAGKILDSVETPSGVDIISVNLSLHHLYLPASSDGSVTVLGIGRQGKLTKLGMFNAAKGTHCVASDDHHRVWVCSPESGSLLVFDDTFLPAE